MAKTNKGRKLFATTATAALVASAIVPVASAAAQINDINSVSSYAAEAVQNLVDRGVITGDQKGNFNPKSTVTRAEAATVLAKALELKVDGTINFSDVKNGAWYYDAIAKVVSNGIFKGQGPDKFNPTGNLTRSEAAIIFVHAFELEGEGNLSTFSDAAQVKTWAEEALSIAVANGVVKGDNGKLNPNSPITKQDFAVMFERAEASIDPATVLTNALLEVKATNEKLTETVTAENVAAAKTAVAAAKTAVTKAEEALKAAKAAEVLTEVEVKAAEEAITAAKAAVEKAEKAVASYEESLLVAKVDAVSATNLKEVEVKFNRAVDEETATDKANYSLKSGKSVKSVSLSEDKMTATVTVEGTLANNKADAISVSNVKAGDKVLNVKHVEFTTVDNKLPEVSSIKSLGTKSVKLVFSEPVEDLKQSHFTLDGKAYFGKVAPGANDRSVILTPYDTNALSVGDHKLNVTGVKDYAGFVSLSSTHEFTVVEDKDAPTVTEATATLETVTLTFSEDVDAETVKSSGVYWKSGDSKKEASRVEPIADNKYKFHFASSEFLPTGKVDIHVDGVKDYSGNQITKDTKVTVTPEVDQTRPEVKKVTAVNARTIEIQFSKDVLESSANIVGSYTVLDKDGKVIAVQSAVPNKNIVTLTLYSDLSNGNNTLRVKNVKDKTKLQNTMLDFDGVVVKADLDQPKIDSKVVNDAQRRVVLGFDKKMDVATLANYSNYLVEIDGVLQGLTSDLADISVIQDGKVVVIVFTEKIGNKAVQFASAGGDTKVQVKKLQVLGLKDVAGNILSNFTTGVGNVIDLSTEVSTALSIEKATLVDSKTVELKFSSGITEAPKSAIEALGGKVIDSIEVNGTSTVKVKFESSIGTNVTNAGFKVNPAALDTLAGKGVPVSPGALLTVGAGGVSVTDKVAPSLVTLDAGNGVYPVKVKGTTGLDAQTLVLTFTEALDNSAFGLLPSDLEIKVNGNIIDTNKLTATRAGTDNNQIEIRVSEHGLNSTDVTVTLLKDRYVTDTSGNEAKLFTGIALKSGDTLKELEAPTGSVPSLTGANNNSTKLVVSFSEPLYNGITKIANGTDVKSLFAYDGTAANYTSATYNAADNTVTFVFTAAEDLKALTSAATLKDGAGNALATETYTYNTASDIWTK